jgi:uncharacterized Tic20 family protein
MRLVTAELRGPLISATVDEGQELTPPGPPSPDPPPPPGPGYGPGYPGYLLPLGYPTGLPSSDERTWAMLAHLSFFVLGIFGPIIVLLTKGKESAFVGDQAVEALNFHITVAIALFVSAILIIVLIGLLLVVVVYVAAAVLTVIGALAANRGERYRYPVAVRIMT